jgi:hypothetical protein
VEWYGNFLKNIQLIYIKVTLLIQFSDIIKIRNKIKKYKIGGIKMKKVLLLAAALLISANLMADEVVFKLGLDKNKTINMTGDAKAEYNPDETITFQVEYFGELDDNLYLGVGANIGSTVEISGDEFVSLIPVYVTGKYKFSGRDARPYIGLKAGYTFASFDNLNYDEEETGGLYIGANAGIEFGSGFMVELSAEQGEYGVEGYGYYGKYKVNYKSPKVGLNIGYSFNLY